MEQRIHDVSKLLRDKYHFAVQHEYACKRIDGRYMRADVYISHPYPAVLEVKIGDALTKKSKIEQQSKMLRDSIDPNILLIGVIFNSNKNEKDLFATFQDRFLMIESGFGVKSEEIAEKIHDCLEIAPPLWIKNALHPEVRSEEHLNRRADGFEKRFGEFNNEMAQLVNVLSNDAFNLVAVEIEEFLLEDMHGHQTSAALRLGRILECILYSLARAHGINLYSKTLDVIEKFDSNIKAIRALMVELVSDDSGIIENRKNECIDKIDTMRSLLDDFIDTLDDNYSLKETDIPLSKEKILALLKKKFIHNKDITKRIQKLRKSSVFASLRHTRNEAAHARADGVHPSITKDKLEQAKQDLKAVLFELCFIGIASNPDQIEGQSGISA